MSIYEFQVCWLYMSRMGTVENLYHVILLFRGKFVVGIEKEGTESLFRRIFHIRWV